MVAENFDKALGTFVRRIPYRPFIVELMNGTRVQVDHPEALVSRGGVAMYLNPEGDWTLFDYHGVTCFTEATDLAGKA